MPETKKILMVAVFFSIGATGFCVSDVFNCLHLSYSLSDLFVLDFVLWSGDFNLYLGDELVCPGLLVHRVFLSALAGPVSLHAARFA